jgi:cysteinyl-tRNA synthetase, unknown class
MNSNLTTIRQGSLTRGCFAALALGLLLVSCNKIHTVFIPPPAPAPDGVDFRQEMRNFVQEISAYARVTDTDFIVIPQNGIELVTDDGLSGGTADTTYLAAISGVGQEDLYYGYYSDNVATPSTVTNYLTPFLDIFKANGKQVMAIDYCSTHTLMDNSYSSNASKFYISFAADHRELDNIPDYPATPYGVNNSDITALADAKNFLYIINPSQYAVKQDFLDAIIATNYDVVLIDLFFNDGTALTAVDITSLKKKQNGHDRLVICYMSIGEAESYRYYWQSGWHYGNPSWLDLRNPNWPGNYKVQYWDPAWQAIIYGNTQTNGYDSYTKQILDAGFDGVYLDIIDAFEYWESR